MSEIKKWKAIGLYDDVTATVGQVIKVAEVDDNGKPIKFENTDSVSSWNDLTDKPFDSEVVIGDILPTMTLTADEEGNISGPSIQLKDGKTYSVNWNGTVYDCVCLETSENGYPLYILGNIGAITGSDLTSEPFIIASAPSEGMSMYKDLNGETTVTVSIIGEIENITKLDGKFLPEGVPYFGKKIGEILSTSTLTVVEDEGMAPITSELAGSMYPGEVYTVSYNGQEYECVAIDGSTLGSPGLVVLGNVGGLTGGEDTGEPFVFIEQNKETIETSGLYAVVAPLDGSTEVTISISGLVKTYNKLPEELMPYDAKSYFIKGSAEGSMMHINSVIESGDYQLGNYAFAEGNSSKASGDYSHAEGHCTIASGNQSHAEGYYTEAIGDGSHTEGYCTIASGGYSHAEGHGRGVNVFVSGDASAVSYTFSSSFNSSYAKKGCIVKNGLVYATIIDYDPSTLTFIVDKTLSDSALSGQVVTIYNTIASGEYSHAEGNCTIASGESSHAEGYNTTASGNQSHTEGCYTIAYGENSHAEGEGANFKGEIVITGEASATTYALSGINYQIMPNQIIHLGAEYARIIDYNSTDLTITVDKTLSNTSLNNQIVELFIDGALNKNSHAEGKSTGAYGEASHAEGSSTRAAGSYSHTEGWYTDATGDYSHAEGWLAKAYGGASHAEGQGSKATGDYSHAEGDNTKATGENSHAEGRSTDANGAASHAEGFGSKTIGDYSHAEGYYTDATGESSHAEGRSTDAIGESSHAEGYSTEASGSFSHAEGDHTKASGNSSHAEGYYAIAFGNYSHAEGNSENTHQSITGEANTLTYTINGSMSSQIKPGRVIEYNGIYALITAIDSDNNTVTLDKTLSTEALDNVRAKFVSCVAYGNNSHAEGYNTTASGNCSHAEGNKTTAYGHYSHAEGNRTTASGDYSHVQGKYNIDDNNYAHIVGNGYSNDTCSNAHTLDWEGNAWFAGDVYVGSTSGTNKDEGSKKLVTIDEMNAAIEAAFANIARAEEASF